MGQYFKLVCPSRNEFVSLPGGMKAIERITNPIAMGMIGYLLFEGPQDGTVFSSKMDIDDPLLEDEIEEIKERERQLEEEKDGYFQPYRNGPNSWNENTLVRTAAAGLAIDEANEYAGRWAGEDVRLVGDYAENDLYDATSENWVYEYREEEFTNYATASAPVVPSSIERDDIEHSTERRDVEPGDLCHVDHPELGEKVYAHFVEVADMEWTNITDGLTAEFVDFVGEEWIESGCESSMVRPDMVISGE